MTNEMVAQKILGWELGAKIGHNRWVIDSSRDKPFDVFMMPDFMDDVRAAMYVVDNMRKQYVFEIDESPKREFHVEFTHINSVNCGSFDATNKSLPTAICTAALKALSGAPNG